MDPPSMPPAKRRVVSMQSGNVSSTQRFFSEGSPSPLVPTPSHIQGGTSISRPALKNQTVSVGWIEEDEPVSRHTSHLQIELAECVETKTVTTTTTTKRSYPPLLIRQQALSELNPKEYPLASKALPPELLKFSYETGAVGSSADLEFEPVSENEPRVHPQSRHVSSARSDAREPTKPSYPIVVKKSHAYRSDRVTKKFSPRRISKGLPEPHFLKSESASEGVEGGALSRLDELKSRPVARHNHGLGVRSLKSQEFPATPDTSELELPLLKSSRRSQPTFENPSHTTHSGVSQNDFFEDAASPSALISDISANSVATPPIADSDLEPFGSANAAFSSNPLRRPSVNIAAAQNASLPSPGLSPAQDEFPDSNIAEDDETGSRDSQNTIENEFPFSAALDYYGAPHADARPKSRASTVSDMLTMIDNFESMPTDMKTVMMFQLLRRCPRKTLHVIADTVNPVLSCNFLVQLPLELSLHVLSFLDHKDLCRAAQVSLQWRSIIDSDETGWKELLDRDGFVLPAGELEKAIRQGWGWQDPSGPAGFEQDLSVQLPEAGTPNDGTSFKTESGSQSSTRKGRSATKRKRSTANTERSKRRATAHEFADKAQAMLAKYPHMTKFHKSEGPITAASQAAAAVPDPELGLPSLRKLHLFKSLYRRHYMLKNNWMSGQVAPHHFAFPAHPAHVITCLQFDDDKILTGSDDTLIHVYDTKTGTLRKKLQGHEGGVWALQYEGNVLVSGSTDRSVRVWDIEKGLCTQVFHGHTSTVRCLQILLPELAGIDARGNPVMLPEKPLIITGSRDSQLRVWKLPEPGSKRYIQTGPPANDDDCPYFVRVLYGHTHSVRAIAAHQDTLVSGSYDNSVRVWKISTGETIHHLTGHDMKVYSVVLDHKRNRCISGSMDNFVKIWDLETGACLYTLEGHTSLVGLLDLKDERLVSAAADSTLRIWDPNTGSCKSTLSAHTGAITCFQHDGQKVISGSDRTLKLWNIKTGECVQDLLTDLSGVWQVKFDERRVVAAVQRDNLTFVEVLDFGASRDGVPASQRGSRRLLPDGDTPIVVEEDDDV